MRHAARFLLATAAAAAFAGAAPIAAHADDTTVSAWNDAGHFQVKVLATAVLPLGHVSSVPNAGVVVPDLVAGTKASNNYVPTIAAEYFLTKNISFETICCMTGHHVTATSGAVKGETLVTNIQIIPATLTVKYHFTGISGAFVPYVGVGPSVFIMMADRPSGFLDSALGTTRTKLSTEPTVALQAGVDAPLSRHWALTFDAKKYFDRTTAHVYVGDTEATAVRLNLMPWVISTGLAYRF